jgi:hypothetical protein
MKRFFLALAVAGSLIGSASADGIFPLFKKPANDCPTPLMYPGTPCPPNAMPSPNGMPLPNAMPSPMMDPNGRPIDPKMDPNVAPNTQPNVPENPQPAPQNNLQAQPDTLAAQGESGSSAGANFTPALFGDLGFGGFIVRRVNTTYVTTNGIRVTQPIETRQPIASRASIKIVENESPVPQNRIYYSFANFNNLNGSALSTPGGANTPADVNGLTPTGNVRRSTLGLEKTVFGPNFSLGARVPFIETTRSLINQSGLGDISLIAKWAILNNPQTGNLLSIGTVVTLPTAGNIESDFTTGGTTSTNNTIIQPFVGYVVNVGQRGYFQGFSSFAAPLATNETALLNNSVGFGYRLINPADNNTLFRYVIPTVEFHLTNPIEYRKAAGSVASSVSGGAISSQDVDAFLSDSFGVPFNNLLILTTGVHIGLAERVNWSFAIGTPITGPKPFDAEVTTSISIAF